MGALAPKLDMLKVIKSKQAQLAQANKGDGDGESKDVGNISKIIEPQTGRAILRNYIEEKAAALKTVGSRVDDVTVQLAQKEAEHRRLAREQEVVAERGSKQGEVLGSRGGERRQGSSQQKLAAWYRQPLGVRRFKRDEPSDIEVVNARRDKLPSVFKRSGGSKIWRQTASVDAAPRRWAKGESTHTSKRRARTATSAPESSLPYLPSLERPIEEDFDMPMSFKSDELVEVAKEGAEQRREQIRKKEEVFRRAIANKNSMHQQFDERHKEFGPRDIIDSNIYKPVVEMREAKRKQIELEEKERQRMMLESEIQKQKQQQNVLKNFDLKQNLEVWQPKEQRDPNSPLMRRSYVGPNSINNSYLHMSPSQTKSTSKRSTRQPSRDQRKRRPMGEDDIRSLFRT